MKNCGPPSGIVEDVGNRGEECAGVEWAFFRGGGDKLERSAAVESDRAPGSTDNPRKVNVGEVGEEGGEQEEDKRFVTYAAGNSGWEDSISGASEDMADVGFTFVALSDTFSHTVRTTGC